MKAEQQVFLLGDSIIDNGEYVRTGEPDVSGQLQTMLPHHTVVKRAVDGANSADVLASQTAEVETAEFIILSAGGNDALEHIDLLEAGTETTTQEVLVRLWSIRDEFRRSYAALLDRLALTRRPVLVLTVYNPCFLAHGFDGGYQRAAESAVSIIDDVIQQEARRRSFDILELRTLFSDQADYANPIEPSAIGGAKLAKRMSDWVRASWQHETWTAGPPTAGKRTQNGTRQRERASGANEPSGRRTPVERVQPNRQLNHSNAAERRNPARPTTRAERNGSAAGGTQKRTRRSHSGEFKLAEPNEPNGA